MSAATDALRVRGDLIQRIDKGFDRDLVRWGSPRSPELGHAPVPISRCASTFERVVDVADKVVVSITIVVSMTVRCGLEQPLHKVSRASQLGAYVAELRRVQLIGVTVLVVLGLLPVLGHKCGNAFVLFEPVDQGITVAPTGIDEVDCQPTNNEWAPGDVRRSCIDHDQTLTTNYGISG